MISSSINDIEDFEDDFYEDDKVGSVKQKSNFLGDEDEEIEEIYKMATEERANLNY
jgi:hypothetical protein